MEILLFYPLKGGDNMQSGRAHLQCVHSELFYIECRLHRISGIGHAVSITVKERV